MPSKQPPLSLAFIGGGINSAVGQTHFAASQMDGNWRVVAGAFSRHPEINRETGETWHVAPERVYDDWHALIANEKGRLDAVAVLTPTPEHTPVLAALLEAGIPIIAEKAVVSRLQDARLLQSLLDRRKHFLAVTFNYTGYPLLRELQFRVQQGELGRIQEIQLEMPQEGFVRPPAIAGRSVGPQTWRLKDDIIPTICLDLGVHLHHIAHFLLDEEPTEVLAKFKTYSQYKSIIDNVSMWLKYDSGASVSFWMTKTAIGCRNGLRVRVFGDQGSAEWFQADPEVLRMSLIDGTHQIIDRGGQSKLCGQARYNRMKVGHPAGFIEAFANLYQDIADALISWRRDKDSQHPYVFGLDHAADGLALFHQARHSAETGGWVLARPNAPALSPARRQVEEAVQ